MAWAIASGAAAATIATRAGSAAGLANQWEAMHRSLIGKRQRTCRLVARVLRSPRLTGLAVRVLSAFPSLARPVVFSLNRPYSPRTRP
jgi:flavin-dependent dehydrogenase